MTKIVPKMFQESKYRYLAFLLYTVAFPLYLFFDEFFGWEFLVYTIPLPEITLIFVIYLLVISIKKDANKKLSIGFLVFLLLYFFGFIILFFDAYFDPNKLGGVIRAFGGPIAYVPIVYFIGCVIYKSFQSNRNPGQNNSLQQGDNKPEETNIQKISVYVFLINAALFFLGISLMFLGDNGLSYYFIALMVNAALTLVGLILSIVSFVRYRKKAGLIFLNILAVVVVLVMWMFIMAASVGV